MKTPWKLRFKFWLCKTFGHRKEFSHHYKQDWRSCKRCGRLVGELE
jgi:hypothetical protein